MYLSRHGETEWNIQGRFQGRADSPLTEHGLAQAAQLAAELADKHLDAILSSDLGRTRRTAEVVAAGQNLAVHFHPGLREVDTGAWTGLSREEIAARWPDELARYRSQPASIRFPDGETLAEVQTRALAALRELLDPLPGQRVAVITHGTLLETLLAHALGLELSALWLRLAHHCQAHALEYRAGRLHVIQLQGQPAPSPLTPTTKS